METTAHDEATRSVLDAHGLPNDVIDSIAAMSVAPTEFDAAFPAVARHVSRCNGELWVFSRGSDAGDFVRLDSCGTSPFEPAPVCIKVLHEEEDGAPSLMEALCDVEACLVWMQDVHGPCEITVCKPGGRYWEECGPEKFLGDEAAKAPRLRGGESGGVALIQPAYWEADEAEVAGVACSGSYSGYRFSAHFPRLDALVNNGCVLPPASLKPAPPSPAVGSKPDAARSPRLRHAKGPGAGAAATASSGGGGSRGGSSRSGWAPKRSPIIADGFVVGTSGVMNTCAALIQRGHTSWEVPRRERMHTANGALSCLEAKLPPAEGEPAGHASQRNKAAAAEAAKPLPYAPFLSRSDVFPLDRFPLKENPKDVQRRENPASAEAEARHMRARLFAGPHFRGGGLFQMCLMEAQRKQANGIELDELDRTVLGPPSEDPGV